MRCVALASTLVETQYDARIDSGPIPALPCVAFLCLVVKKPPTFLVINLCVSRINALQGLSSLCESALIDGRSARVPEVYINVYWFIFCADNSKIGAREGVCHLVGTVAVYPDCGLVSWS